MGASVTCCLDAEQPLNNQPLPSSIWTTPKRQPCRRTPRKLRHNPPSLLPFSPSVTRSGVPTPFPRPQTQPSRAGRRQEEGRRGRRRRRGGQPAHAERAAADADADGDQPVRRAAQPLGRLLPDAAQGASFCPMLLSMQPRICCPPAQHSSCPFPYCCSSTDRLCTVRRHEAHECVNSSHCMFMQFAPVLVCEHIVQPHNGPKANLLCSHGQCLLICISLCRCCSTGPSRRGGSSH